MKLTNFTILHYLFGLLYNTFQVIVLYHYVDTCDCMIHYITDFRLYFIIVHFLNIIPSMSSYNQTSCWKLKYNLENIHIKGHTIKLTEFNKYLSNVAYIVNIILDVITLCNTVFFSILLIILACLDIILMSLMIAFSPLFVLQIKKNLIISDKYIEDDVSQLISVQTQQQEEI